MRHRSTKPLLLIFISLLLISCSLASEPAVYTRGANRIKPTSAQLSGVVVSGDDACRAWFEWGAGTLMDQSSPDFDVAPGRGLTQLAFAATNLAPRTIYTCRLVVSNEHGVRYGAKRLFDTGKKVTVWGGSAQGQYQIPVGLSNVVSLTAGGAHLVALQADGAVTAWGQNGAGQTNVPSYATNVVEVFARDASSMVLREDGILRGWGDNTGGQLDVPQGATNVVAFDMANGQCLAVRGDGSVIAWGTQTNGPGPVPAGLTNVVEVACGPIQNLALKADGTLLQWPTPAPGEVTNVVAITSGHLVHLAILSDGTVRAWDSSSVLLSNLPSELTNVVQLSAGGTHYLALSAGGSVSAWGQSSYGALAIPAGIEPLASVVAGTDFSAALGANLAPQPEPGMVNGLPNHDLEIKLAASDQNGDAMTLRIVSLPEQGALFQWENGIRGSPIASVGTEILDATWRVVFAPATNTAGVPYAHFRFTANDGEADALAPAEVTVNVPGSPVGFMLPPASIQAVGVTLAGMAFSGGLPSTAWFEWGTNFQERSALMHLEGKTTPEYLQAHIGALAQGLAWQARLVVSNSQGMVLGHPRRFATGLKVHAWGRNDQGAATPPAGTSRVVHIAGNQSSGTTGHFSVAVRDNGSLVAWGTNTAGQLNVPAGVTNAVMAAAGGVHGLALCSDGSVITWGSTNNGLAKVPTGLTNAVEVAAGQSHSLALTREGEVVAWGANDWGQTNVPASLEGAVAIAAFDSASYALRADGTVLGWGTAANPGITNAVALGGKHAILRDGSLMSFAPGALPEVGNYVAVASGNTHAVVLRGDGAVTGRGYSTFGGASIPAGLSEVVTVGAGRDHSLAIGANSAPEAFGSVASVRAGSERVIQLRGGDSNGDRLSFQITTLPVRGALYQWAEGTRGAAIADPGTWVSDSFGRVIYVPGTPGIISPYDAFDFRAEDGEEFSSPSAVTLYMRGEQFANTVSAIDVQPNRATCRGFISPNGYPTHAWFELRTKGGSSFATQPKLVGATSGVVWLAETVAQLDRVPYYYRLVASNETGVTFGSEQVFGLGRSFFTWGANDRLQIQPYLPDLVDYTAVACGNSHTLALQVDGKVVSWGDKIFGQQNVPTNLNNAVALAASGSCSVALKRDGTLVGWGGQAGPYPIPSSIPAFVTNIMEVSIGANHGIALRTNGQVICWGFSQYGQTNIPKGLSNVVAVAAGPSHCLALKDDGTVVAWGLNTAGQTNVPTGLSEVVGVAASLENSYAILRNGVIVGWGRGAIGTYPLPEAATPSVELVPSGGFNLSLRPDLTVFGWGTNNLSQTNMPAGISNAVCLAVGDRHAVVLAADPLVPYVNSLPVVVHENDGFRFDGFVTPNAESAAVWFEWGRVGSFDQMLGLTNLDGARGFTCVSAVCNEVNAGTVYNCRIAASNRFGVARSATHLFGASNKLVYWGGTNGPGSIGLMAPVGGLESMVGIGLAGPTTRLLFSSGFVLQSMDYMSGITGAVALACSPGVNVALVSDGKVMHETVSSQVYVPNVTNAVAIAANTGQYLTLRADGTVAKWGSNPSTATNVIAPKETVGIGTSTGSPVFLRSDGSVFVGAAMAPGLKDVVAVSCPANESTGTIYAIRRDGAVLKYSSGFVSVVAGLTNCVQLVTGTINALVYLIALSADSTVHGVGNAPQCTVPQPFSNVVAIASANYVGASLVAGASAPMRAVTSAATAVRSNTATLNAWVAPHWTATTAWFEWGAEFGMNRRTAPRFISTRGALARLSEPIQDISPGVIYHFRVAASNYQGVVYGNERVFGSGWKVAVWGDKNYGQLGVPRTLRNVSALAAGEDHTIALTADGLVQGWGFNDQGQVAIPAGLNSVASISCGDHVSMALTENSMVTQWGYNASSPTFTNVIAMDAGYERNYAQLAGGPVRPWPTSSFLVIPPECVDFSAQEFYGVAVQGNGTINYFGYTSPYSSDPNFAPPPGLTNIAAVAVGNHTVMAVRDGGSVVAWGQFDYGQSVIPPGLDRAVAVAAGEGHCLALKSDGTVSAWGLNADGQADVPQGLTNVVAIAAGAFHSVAVGANVPPKALPLQLALPHRDPLVINLAAADPNNDPLSFFIHQLPSRGNLFQCDNGLIGAAISAAGTTVSDPGGRVVFVPDSVGPDDPLATFEYGARDDEIAGYTAVASIRIASPEPARVTSFGWSTNGAFRVVFTGDSNLTQCVQVSTNLVHWQLLGIATPVSPGAYQILDPTAAIYPQRFYRVDSGCAPAGAQMIQFAKPEATAIDVRFSGAPNARYRVWASADLVAWIPMGYASEIEPGLFRYLDTQAKGVPRRFYKAGPN